MTQATPAAQADFESKMRALRGILLGAQGNMDIWTELSTPEALEHLDPTAPYCAFFLWARNSQADFAYVRLAIATDRDRRQPSVYEIMRLSDEHPGLLAGPLDTDGLVTRIERQRGTISSIQRFRHQAVAHYEVGADPPPVDYQDCSLLLRELEDVFNAIHSAWKPGEVWAFEPLQSPRRQTARLIDDLKRFWSGEHPYPTYPTERKKA